LQISLGFEIVLHLAFSLGHGIGGGGNGGGYKKQRRNKKVVTEQRVTNVVSKGI